MMDWEQVFSIVSTLALIGWVPLILGLRDVRLLGAIRYGVVGLLALTYAILILLYFFRIEGGGFGSLAAVKRLLSSDPVLVAGWIHYLAFDLFVGVWIAEQSGPRGIARLIQAPILAATFIFGPLGLALFYALRGVDHLSGRRSALSRDG